MSLLKKLLITIKLSNINYKNMTIPEKIEYIKNLAINNIHEITRKLNFDSFEVIKTHFKHSLYFVIYTLPQKNHPIIGFVSIKNNADTIYLIRPLGKKHYNISIEELNEILNYKLINKKEIIYAIYLSLIKSIIVRKQEILLDKNHSLLNCNNIKGCITLTKKNKNNNINNNTKKKKIANLRSNAIKILRKYFKYLEHNEFDKARTMIGDNKHNSTEFNLTFRSLKKLRGHIEIFISLYEQTYYIINYYKSL